MLHDKAVNGACDVEAIAVSVSIKCILFFRSRVNSFGSITGSYIL